MAKEDLVKIIPKPRPKTPGYIYFLFWSGLILLVGLIISFFFLQSKTIVLEATRERLAKEVIVSQKEEDIEKEISIISEQIKDFPALFEKHQNFSKAFIFLSDFCHPKVQFNSLQLTGKDYQISLTGQTESFQTLGEQIIGLKRNKNIKEIQLSHISLNKKGKITFGLRFTFPKDLVQK